MQKNADKLRRLVRLKSANPNQERSRRAGFMGLFGHRVDLLDHYEKKLEDIEENVRAEQSSTLGKVIVRIYIFLFCMQDVCFTIRNLYLDMASTLLLVLSFCLHEGLLFFMCIELSIHSTVWI